MIPIHQILRCGYCLVLVSACLTSSSQDLSIPGINLNNAKVIKRSEDSSSIAAFEFSATKYLIKSQQTITKRTGRLPGTEKKKKAIVWLEIYHKSDSACVLRDSIYETISCYWELQEQEYKRNPRRVGQDSIEYSRGDFRYLPKHSGFFSCSGDTVPYVSSEHRSSGSFFILYFRNEFYKVSLLKSKGIGGLDFIYKNMRFTDGQLDYTIDTVLTSWLDEIRTILSNRKECG